MISVSTASSPSVRLVSTVQMALVFAAGLLVALGIDHFFEPW